MDQVYTAVFCSAFFSILFVLALLVRQTTEGALVVPNSALPQSLQFIGNSKQGVPWTSRTGSKITRTLKCRGTLCSQQTFLITLPVLDNPEQSNQVWDPISNAWTLTQEMFLTGYPLEYPFATVVNVPRDTPDHVKFILPALRAANEDELNVTGPYANAFVLNNTSTHDLYFYRDSTSYWILKPSSQTLLWPSSPVSSSTETWLAYSLSKNTTDEQAAYFAEALMYSRV